MNANMSPPQMGEWIRPPDMRFGHGAVYYAAVMSGRGWYVQFVRATWNERTQVVELRETSRMSGAYYNVGDYHWFAEAIGELPGDMLQCMLPDHNQQKDKR